MTYEILQAGRSGTDVLLSEPHPCPCCGRHTAWYRQVQTANDLVSGCVYCVDNPERGRP